jgi:dCMP deaminase
MCRGSHAEINAIVQAAAVGSSTRDGELYCTTEPCSFCTKAIINAGILRVVYLYSYPDSLARELRRMAKIEVVCLKDSPDEDLIVAKS